jgi:hypothetical protein
MREEQQKNRKRRNSRQKTAVFGETDRNGKKEKKNAISHLPSNSLHIKS